MERVFETLTIKSILIILNSFNITSALVHIIVILLFYKDEQKTEDVLMNYTTMVISAICCAAAVMNSSCILQITGNVFLSVIVARIVVWIHYKQFSTYTILFMILHGIIASNTYYLAQRIRKTKLHNLISTYTGVAAMPLNPPPHVRSDVI